MRRAADRDKGERVVAIVENSGARRIALYPDAIVGAWGKLRGYKPGVGAGVRYACGQAED